MAFLVVKWTLPALLAGAQSVIRLPCADRTAAQYRAGSVIPVYAKAPQYGGRVLAELRFVGDPVHELLCDVPNDDYEAMGWSWMHSHPEVLLACFGPRITVQDFSWDAFERWRRRPGIVWTLRFEVVALARPAGNRSSQAAA